MLDLTPGAEGEKRGEEGEREVMAVNRDDLHIRIIHYPAAIKSNFYAWVLISLLVPKSDPLLRIL